MCLSKHTNQNRKKVPSMAGSSPFLPPLCERISPKSYVLRVMDLTILSLLFSLLVYRILHMSQNDTAWVVAFFCESCFFFVWLLITSTKWSPADHKTYPDRLDERYRFHLHACNYIQSYTFCFCWSQYNHIH